MDKPVLAFLHDLKTLSSVEKNNTTSFLGASQRALLTLGCHAPGRNSVTSSHHHRLILLTGNTA